MAEVDTITVLDSNGVEREVPTLLSLETLLTGVAHDAAASGVNPVLVGGYASTAAPTAVSTATDAVRAWLTLNGAVVTKPISLTVANSRVAPTNTAGTLIAARDGRTGVLFKNVGTVTAYLGIATVTTSNGCPLDPGEWAYYPTAALIQAITASGTADIAVTEFY